LVGIYGVDVHARYQGGLDVGLLARQGYSFLATKLSQGLAVPTVDGFTAAQFKARALLWLEQTHAAGMVPGAYHWVDASGSGAAQARFFYGLVKEAGGPDGMLIQLDNEDNATWQVTRDWASEWQQLSGGHPWLMYTGGWWWRPRGWDGATLTPYLWESRYLSADADTVADDPAAFASRIPADWWRLPDPSRPGVYGYGGWSRATMFQFTSRGDAGSLGNNVDLDVFPGSREQLLALTTTTGDDMTPLQARVLWNIGWIATGLANNEDPIVIPAHPATKDEPWDAPAASLPNNLAQDLAALDAKVTALAIGGGLSQDQARTVVREELDRTRLGS
jgi:GH25 family lysozyme M1 (1,4-beta-N-acetylmuramidase)